MKGGEGYRPAERETKVGDAVLPEPIGFPFVVDHEEADFSFHIVCDLALEPRPGSSDRRDRDPPRCALAVFSDDVVDDLVGNGGAKDTVHEMATDRGQKRRQQRHAQ